MASTAALELLISLRDEASKGVSSLGKNVGELGKHMDDAKQKGSGFLGGIGGGVSTLAGFATGIGGVVAVGAGLTDFFGDAMSEAKEAQAGMAQLTAVLESTGGAVGMTADEILDLSSKLSASNGMSKFSDDAVLAGQNLLLTFTNIGESVFPMASQAMVDMATAMGTDVKGGAIQLGKALNDPVAGISALSRVGVTFTDQQKDMIASMVAAGDTAGAQKVILAELGKEFGGSALASAQTFEGRMTTLSETFNGVKQSVGEALMPVLEKLVGWFSSPAVMSGIQAIATGLIDGIGKAVDWISNAFTQAQPTIEAFFNWLTSPEVTANISAIGSAIMEGIGAAVKFLWDMLVGAWPTIQAVFTYLTSPEFTSTIMNIGAAIGQFLVQAWNTLSQVLTAVWPIIQGVFTYLTSPEFTSTIMNIATIIGQVLVQAWNALVAAFNFVLPIIQQVWSYLTSPEVVSTVTNIATAIGSALAEAFTIVSNVVSAVWPVVEAVITTGIAVIGSLWETFWPSIVAVFEGVWTSFTGLVEIGWSIIQGIWNTATELLKGNWEGAWNAIVQMFQGIWNGLQTYIQGAWQVVQGYFTAALAAIQAIWTAAWNTVSTFFTGIWNAIVTFVGEQINNVKQSIDNTTKQISDAWNTVWGAISTFLSNTWDTISGAVSGAINAVSTTISGVMTAIQNGWNTVWGAISTFLTTTWDGIKTGVENAINAVKSKIDEVMGNVKTAWNNAWNAVVTKIGEVVTSVGTKMGEIVGAITTAAGNALNEAGKIGSNIISGIMGALEAGKQGVINFILGIAGGAVDAVKNFFGIKSPSKLMYDIFGYVVEGANKGIQDKAPESVQVARDWMGQMYDSAKDKLGDIKDLGLLWDQTLADGMSLNTDITSDMARSLIGKALDTTHATVRDAAPTFAATCFDYGQQGAIALADGFAGAAALLTGRPLPTQNAPGVSNGDWLRDTLPMATGWNGTTTGGGRGGILAAKGFHGWVNGPTPILAGEAGSEYVSITPRSQMGSGGGGLTIQHLTIHASSPAEGRRAADAFVDQLSVRQADMHRLMNSGGRS